MRVQVSREKPESWEERRARLKRAWAALFWWMEYEMEWAAYLLSKWTFLEVLEYLSSFGVLIAVIFYFAESGDRLKQKHYQAWEVINTAQGKGGNGGRIDALQELNKDGVPLVGIDLSMAFLQGIRLKRANLLRADMSGADARAAEMPGANLDDSILRWANFREGNMRGVSLRRSDLDNADLTGADLRNADLTRASLEDADLSDADLQGAKWGELKSVKGANVFGVKGPPGFVEWVLAHGGVARKKKEE